MEELRFPVNAVSNICTLCVVFGRGRGWGGVWWTLGKSAFLNCCRDFRFGRVELIMVICCCCFVCGWSLPNTSLELLLLLVLFWLHFGFVWSSFVVAQLLLQLRARPESWSRAPCPHPIVASSVTSWDQHPHRCVHTDNPNDTLYPHYAFSIFSTGLDGGGSRD